MNQTAKTVEAQSLKPGDVLYEKGTVVRVGEVEESRPPATGFEVPLTIAWDRVGMKHVHMGYLAGFEVTGQRPVTRRQRVLARVQEIKQHLAELSPIC